MSKYFSIFLAIILIVPSILHSTSSDHNRQFTTSHTFLFNRPIYYNITAQYSLWNSIVHDKAGANCAAGQITGMYQKSDRTKKLGGYFLLHCKDCVTIRGDNATNSQNRDIRAEYFNLPSNYSGTFCLKPEQEQAAVVLEFNQNLSTYFSDSL